MRTLSPLLLAEGFAVTVALAASAPTGAAVVVDDEQRLERDRFALVHDLLDLDHVTGPHLVLLARS